MATALSAANSCCSTRIQFLFNNNRCYNNKQNLNLFKIRASSNEQQEDDCNVEECAPDKEVGKVSMEWLAGDKTKVTGTFPPRRREWSGYVEKDTAGQTNIYSVEVNAAAFLISFNLHTFSLPFTCDQIGRFGFSKPAVYVAESAISSGTSGTSADGAENTVAVVAFSGIIAVAAASVVLFQVGKNPPPVQTLDYSGPSLSYYITKFKPSEVVQISVPQSENSTTQVESGTLETESSAPSDNSSTQVDSGTQEIATSTSAEQTEIILPQVSEVQVESG